MANNFSGDSDCKALWRFESGALTTDSQGTNTLSTPSAGSADTTNKKEGGASLSVGFNNRYYRTDSDLDAGFPLKDGDTTKTISVCCWVRETTAGAWQAIWSKDNYYWGSKNSLGCHSNSGNLTLTWGKSGYGADAIDTGFDLADEEWYHVAVVVDGVNKTVKVRVYRVSDDSVSNYTETHALELNVSDNSFYICRFADDYQSFYGNVDELVVFSRLLSDEDIDAIRDGTYSTSAVPYDDGTPSGGIVFGGQVVEVGTINYTDPAASGGIVFGGEEVSADENHQVDGVASGGIVFGGGSSEKWQAEPNNWVAVKGGTYRIGGTIYTLPATMTYEGLGSIAALVNCGAAPVSAGTYRYDLLSVNAAGTITVTAGTAAATPVMPATPAGEVKLDHVLRYYGQGSIVQGDIGKLYTAPTLTTITAVVTDDELAWAELSTTIILTFRDQNGALYTGAKTITASFLLGNGTIAPTSKSGSGSSFTFTYTRGGNDPGDESPVLQFLSSTGPSAIAQITLLDSDGDPMFPS